MRRRAITVIALLVVALLSSTVAVARGLRAASKVVNRPPPPQTPVASTVPFWVADRVSEPRDNACYRKTYRGKKCPRGYDSDNLGTCWAQCPFEYPVECGMEWLPMNQRCSKAVFRKVASVVTTAMNALTAGVFGQLMSASKLVKQGVDCGGKVLPVIEHIVDFAQQQGDLADTSTVGHIKQALTQKSLVTEDLPTAVSVCLGLELPSSVGPSEKVMEVVNLVIDTTMDALVNGENPANTETLMKILKIAGLGGGGVGGGSVRRRLRSSGLTFTDAKQLMELGVTCGSDMKRIVDGIVEAVKTIKNDGVDDTTESIRFAVTNSDLFLKVLPDTALQCVNVTAPDAFQTHDKILTTMQTIIDKLLDATTDDDGKPMAAADYALSVANLGLDALSTFDPTGLADLTKEFVQPICGPTIFVQAIDAGPADKAVGLRTMDDAFEGSSGKWTTTSSSPQSDDRAVHISFMSSDDKDVVVQIKSGGNDYHDVKVAAGQSVSWSTPLTEVQGKTLYMVRSRPGFLGIKDKGGGSLLVWVPEVGPQGKEDLRLEVKINAPNGSDADNENLEGGTNVDAAFDASSSSSLIDTETHGSGVGEQQTGSRQVEPAMLPGPEISQGDQADEWCAVDEHDDDLQHEEEAPAVTVL